MRLKAAAARTTSRGPVSTSRGPAVAGASASAASARSCKGWVAARTAHAQSTANSSSCSASEAQAQRVLPSQVVCLRHLNEADGPLLLAKDRDGGLRYDDSTVYPPDAELWG